MAFKKLNEQKKKFRELTKNHKLLAGPLVISLRVRVNEL